MAGRGCRERRGPWARGAHIPDLRVAWAGQRETSAQPGGWDKWWPRAMAPGHGRVLFQTLVTPCWVLPGRNFSRDAGSGAHPPLSDFGALLGFCARGHSSSRPRGDELGPGPPSWGSLEPSVAMRAALTPPSFPEGRGSSDTSSRSPEHTRGRRAGTGGPVRPSVRRCGGRKQQALTPDRWGRRGRGGGAGRGLAHGPPRGPLSVGPSPAPGSAQTPTLCPLEAPRGSWGGPLLAPRGLREPPMRPAGERHLFPCVCFPNRVPSSLCHCRWLTLARGL